MDVQYDIDNLIANPNGKVGIAIEGNPPFIARAFTTDETFSVASSAQYESFFQQTAGGILEGMGNKGAAAKTVMNALGIKTETFGNSAARYVTSEKPQFQLNLLFVAVRTNDDPREPVKNLLAFTAPKGEANPSLLDRLRPPHGYSLQGQLDVEKATGYEDLGGFMSVQIGRWFRATKLILTAVSFEFSTVTTRRGVPLYAAGSISFEPYRVITSEEFKNYFMSENQGVW